MTGTDDAVVLDRRQRHLRQTAAVLQRFEPFDDVEVDGSLFPIGPDESLGERVVKARSGARVDGNWSAQFNNGGAADVELTAAGWRWSSPTQKDSSAVSSMLNGWMSPWQMTAASSPVA
jgi:hypothetical protein